MMKQRSTERDSGLYEQILPVSEIYTKFDDILNEFNPDANAIEILQDAYRKSKEIQPILVSTEDNGSHFVIDGYHRFYAALKEGRNYVNCIVWDVTFKQSEALREAEVLLHEFDRTTDRKYEASWFLKEFISYKTGAPCPNYFSDALHLTWRTQTNNVLRDSKRALRRKCERRAWSTKAWLFMKKIKKALYKK